jgi:hypothetical protein
LSAVTALLLKLTRVWLPVLIAVAGVAAIVAGHANTNSVVAAAGVALVIVALVVWMINWLYRLSIESNRDRDDEDRARDYFDRHGRWPEEGNAPDD